MRHTVRVDMDQFGSTIVLYGSTEGHVPTLRKI